MVVPGGFDPPSMEVRVLQWEPRDRAALGAEGVCKTLSIWSGGSNPLYPTRRNMTMMDWVLIVIILIFLSVATLIPIIKLLESNRKFNEETDRIIADIKSRHFK